ncbi:hypothetical protein [Streptomyces sp. SCL15-6]|uniref:hypothetical protein n=1 Tax=Streptomyces sp. SCL15-6 TaxID=2967222 RepID=UPI002966CE2F|nr:hypothetical protein [Streptomyces sp. SCL15-6]
MASITPGPNHFDRTINTSKVPECDLPAEEALQSVQDESSDKSGKKEASGEALGGEGLGTWAGVASLYMQGLVVRSERESSHPVPGGGQRGADHGAASRLLADLARAGWPATALAARLGVNARTIAEIRDRRSRLHLDLALLIRRLHPS